MKKGVSTGRWDAGRPARPGRYGSGIVVLAAALGAAGWLASAPREWAGHRDKDDKGNRDGIIIVLPPRLAAGENATLAAVARDGKVLPGVTVELSSGNQVTTDSTGRALFAVPVDGRVLLAYAAASGGKTVGPVSKGKNAAGEADSSEREAALIVAPVPRPLQIVSLPPWVGMRDRFVIRGFGFMGDATANRIFIGGQARLVLAASSLALVVAGSERAEPGPTTVVTQTKDAAKSATLTLVGVSMTSDSGALAPGKSGTLEFQVTGTEQLRAVEVRNLTPDVIRLPRGNFQHVESSGGAHNIIEIAARGLRDGDFSVEVRLMPAVEAPDIEAARTFLEAAHARADHGMRRQIEKWIASLGDQSTIGNMTKQMERAADRTADAGPVALDRAALIRAARNALRGTDK